MTLRITVPGADFSGVGIGRYLKLTTDRADLVGEYIFGKSKNASIFNGANNALPLIETGAPVYDDASVTLSTSNWFDTLVSDAQELTLMVIADMNVSGIHFIGNWGGVPSANQLTMYKNGSTVALQTPRAAGSPPSTITSSTGLSGIGPHFRGLACRTTGLVDFTSKVDQYRGGLHMGGASFVNAGETRLVVPSPLISIGSARGSSIFPGPVKVAAALIWHRALSDADLLAAYQEARGVLAGRGIDC